MISRSLPELVCYRHSIDRLEQQFEREGKFYLHDDH